MIVYQFLTNLASPIVNFYLKTRLVCGKEDKERFAERKGVPSKKRPEGGLIWCHAVSVGEVLSVISLVKEILEKFPCWNFLITTCTVTSAKLIADRLPKNCVHQYVPVDIPSYVKRFVDYWRPDIFLCVESELWPNMLYEIGKRKIPAFLLNARISENTLKRWSFVKKWAEKVVNVFSVIFAQDEMEAKRFRKLNAKNIICLGNLKFASAPLPCNETELDRLRSLIGNRPVWLMASTHKGEEEIAASVHAHLRLRWPNLLTVIAPRHAQRGSEIAKNLRKFGFQITQRSLQKNLSSKTEIYLADTMGELGLFYRLVPLVCIGGTFTWKGHNPIEPAQLGCAIIFGPNMTNFFSIAEEMLNKGLVFQVHSPNELAVRVEQMLSSPEEMLVLGNASRSFVEQKKGVLEEVIKVLSPWLSLKAHTVI